MKPRAVQQARWSEPIIMELGSPGERGLCVAPVEEGIERLVGDGVGVLPANMRRAKLPALPEISQARVLRHFLRLSQETLGADLNPDFLGTCTMKPAPRVNEELIRDTRLADLHPLQDDDSVQGLLEIMARVEHMLCELSGMSRFSFQPGGGAHAIYTNALILRAYHRSRGEDGARDEIITSIFSHPSDAACPAAAGYKVVKLYPGPQGYPELDALKAAVSERTAGLMITNPEDTGLFNPEIDRFTEVVHDAGGLCAYDQANANGSLGVARARDAGFDLCQFNIHKTFAGAHCSLGVACGAAGASELLERFLPVPLVSRGKERLFLDHERPESIGRVRSFVGVPVAVVRAYAWLTALGGDGVRHAAETAVLNNNYLVERLRGVEGVEPSYGSTNPNPRLEQTRYTWEELHEETGIETREMSRRTGDFGVTPYMTSHEPWVVPQPMTLEPTESYSRSDIDEYAAIISEVAQEAHATPGVVRDAPHRTAMRKLDEADSLPEGVATTWRAFRRAKPQDSPSERASGTTPSR